MKDKLGKLNLLGVVCSEFNNEEIEWEAKNAMMKFFLSSSINLYNYSTCTS